MPTAPSPPAPAATALVVRDAGGTVEVLLLRRGQAMAVLGGFWAFPGGAVDPDDAATPVVGSPGDASIPAALVVAACRELHEETGLLLAVHDDGSPPDLADLAALRDLATAGTPFAALLRHRSLSVDLGQLLHWAHWITPTAIKRRFDTRFFVAAAPPRQQAVVASAENSEARWVDVERLASGAASDTPITPPTAIVLRELVESLARHGSLAAVFDNERTRVVPSVLPKVWQDGDSDCVVLPWDPAYDAIPGETLPWSAQAIAGRAGWPTRVPLVVPRTR